jgi:hypothetical protein
VPFHLHRAAAPLKHPVASKGCAAVPVPPHLSRACRGVRSVALLQPPHPRAPRCPSYHPRQHGCTPRTFVRTRTKVPPPAAHPLSLARGPDSAASAPGYSTSDQTMGGATQIRSIFVSSAGPVWPDTPAGLHQGSRRGGVRRPCCGGSEEPMRVGWRQGGPGRESVREAAVTHASWQCVVLALVSRRLCFPQPDPTTPEAVRFGCSKIWKHGTRLAPAIICKPWRPCMRAPRWP